MEDAAKWPATGLENQGTADNCRGSIPPSSATTGSRKARRCADNAEVEGAVPSRWIFYEVFRNGWLAERMMHPAFNRHQRGSTPLLPIY
jgi:hypothetical protein